MSPSNVPSIDSGKHMGPGYKKTGHANCCTKVVVNLDWDRLAACVRFAKMTVLLADFYYLLYECMEQWSSLAANLASASTPCIVFN